MAPLYVFILLLLSVASALRYDPALVDYNLNENKTATEPRDYWGKRENHTFHPSPSNWRFPFYVLTIDRFVDGDPTNNEANGTVFEHDWMSTQFRFGGDVAGVVDNLDYLQGLGIKGIYFTGSMMLNMPFSPDGYGPLDFTLLDKHHGTIQEWRNMIDEVHRRGMYAIFDNTMATMGDLMAYAEPYTNDTVGFAFGEYDYVWKDPSRQYHDFHPSNDWDPNCKMPDIWEQNGYLAKQDVMEQFTGCRDSEFDMYGDIKGTGAYPSYINQMSRFASVQDRLREWRPDVLEKINVMTCIMIQSLDTDGIRVDKAVQSTLDALADFSSYQRQCAKRLGKDNFLVVGEVVADPKLAATYYGRGKKPDQALAVASQAVVSSNETDPDSYIRAWGMTALDGAAFHYDIYGSLTRFLGLDGPWGSHGVDWVEFWNTMLADHDLVNANTGLFDPRHMYGTTNQDVFRWPALANGTQRQLLGLFVTTLELPGIPMVFFGEEQEFYILENAAPDYVYGRTPMASSRAWQLHGCYGLGEEVYVDMPFNQSGTGCTDDTVSLDHRDPSHPMRNVLKRFFELREHYPVLNDGYNLTTLSTRIYDIFLRGSQGMASPHGIWSVYRGRNVEVQDFTGQGYGNLPVWLLFHNENRTVTYDFDCGSDNNTSPDGSLLSAFATGATVKNLLYPYDEYTLEDSTFTLELNNATDLNGCLAQITLPPWGFKAFVPIDSWHSPQPVITKSSPRHDERIVASSSYNDTQTLPIEIHFSKEMDCDSVRDSLSLVSVTESGEHARLQNSSVRCNVVDETGSNLVAQVASAYTFSAILENVAHGVHSYTISNASAMNGDGRTNAKDKFIFRVGSKDNPMIFPEIANYTKGLLQQDESTKELFVIPQAAGADLVRYSTNWGSSYSPWQQYSGDKIVLTKQPWSGTTQQEWEGEHVILNYWSKLTGSSEHFQHSDLGREDKPARRWPHAWVEGIFNQFGYDAGIKNEMKQNQDGEWMFDLFTSWPTNITVNVWGMNPSGHPDKSAAFGDLDRDGVLDSVWPNSIAANFLNISQPPLHGRVGYKLLANDGNYSYRLQPYGSQAVQLVVMVLLCVLPLLSAVVGIRLFMGAFYKVKLNRVGSGAATRSLSFRSVLSYLRHPQLLFNILFASKAENRSPSEGTDDSESQSRSGSPTDAFAVATGSDARRTVLIATAEYEVEDYGVKIKIGGLGVMASVMAKNLGHQNLVWVVPCVGGVDYPFEQGAESESIVITILNEAHEILIHVHNVRNITYVFLDSPIFRARTKAEPYCPKMDDLESGIYYSAWNQCIAEVWRRYKPDLYHINDYHGAAAPLYLLPEVIPCCLSLHNAEFQGMWKLGTQDQMTEVSSIFNLSTDVIKKYVQFGEVFNLLHAGASYLRIHQQGFGAVGVSKKYGKRSLARYPALWGLTEVGGLPNPDPSDQAPLDKLPGVLNVQVDLEKERERGELRKQAQQWAGLMVDPSAELFIFVGRWSMQKGIDLIADVFPTILEKHEKTQLICVGPVIDMYGKFAALKLEKLMAKYPGRVFSKPEFTALPPYLFGGAEFALMPSRDEPFGLVAVEFGRKGALCIGARVGGFGHMPGWWFTIEAMQVKHLAKQFNKAISAALASDYETRAMMRAYSLLQRFPVAQWVTDLQILQSRSIEASRQSKAKSGNITKLKSAIFNSSALSLATTRTAIETPPLPTPFADSPRTTPMIISPASSLPTSRPVSINTGDTARYDSHDLIPAFHPRITSPDRADSPIAGDEPEIEEIRPSARSRKPASVDANNSLDAAILCRNLSRIADGRKSIGQTSMATPTFNDSRNTYYNLFSRKLDKLYARNTYSSLSIEEYIQDSEKEWFNGYHTASMNGSQASTRVHSRAQSRTRESLPTQGHRSTSSVDLSMNPTIDHGRNEKNPNLIEFAEILGEDYVAPRGCRKVLQLKIGGWHLYCFLLMFGQIISASSYQLTLLTGSVGEPADKLYTICAIYFVASLAWWIMYRRVQAVYCLSLPWLFFGACFLFLGLSKAFASSFARGWMFNVASGLYAVGSAAGALFFSLNFGTEGGTPTQIWAFRACVIGGTQNLLIAFLWYWGSYLTHSSDTNYTPSSTTLTAVSIPLAILMWAIGCVLFLGLPDYYRQIPGSIPSFYRAISRRGVVIWFLVMVILQNYWLSAPYQRNWLYLWSDPNAPKWATSLLVILFFVIIWAGMVGILGYQSKQHSWIFPMFAICLGAPRWCQMLWSLSGIGFHVPWAGLVGGGLVSRAVWLWLGVLDALQGVGFGMILFMTLTRLHITFTLIMAQSVGAIFTILARATAPNKLGAGDVFINLLSESLASVWFWVALLCQLVICLGYLKFFRKAQLMKP